jgi:hypothetical protein
LICACGLLAGVMVVGGIGGIGGIGGEAGTAVDRRVG